MHKQRVFILVAAGVGLLGCLLPWQIASAGFFGTLSYNAFSSGWVGYATLLGVLAAAGIIFKDSDKTVVLPADTRKVVIVAGGAVVLFSLLGIIIISSNATGNYGFGISMGMGPILCLIAGVGVLGVPFAIKGDGSFKMPTKDSIKEDMK